MVSIIPIKSPIIKPEDDLLDGVKLKEKDIIVIASKVVSITEKRFVDNKKITRDKLIKKEADKVLTKEYPYLTIKNGIISPNAGVDESNAYQNSFMLWPKNPQKSAQNLWQKMRKKYGIQKLGVIIADSTCYPLKKGTIQIAIGFAGIEAVKDYRGKKDIHGKHMKISQSSIVDSLAGASGIVMGEGNEQIPYTIIRGAKCKFSNNPKPLNKMLKSKCIYKNLYQ